MSGRPLPFVALIVVLSGCAPSASDEAASLCEDLGNLAATVSLISAPPEDATVGQVRGATEKLDPTIDQAEHAGVVPDPEGEGFRAAQEAVLESLKGIGDDTPIPEVPADRLAPIDELTTRYEGIVASLGCSELGATGA